MAFKTAIFAILGVTCIYGFPFDNRIVNGTDAIDGEFPYIVSLRYLNYHSCGGSIISEYWILTAAHCIFGGINQATILFGTVDLHYGQSPPEFVRSVKRAIRHPNYQPFGGYENDVALIELQEPITFSDNAKAVKLAPANAPTPGNAAAVLIGWGYDKSGGNIMDVLQKVDIKIYTETDCYNAHHGMANPEVHVCAGIPEGGKGQCSGDSGGPLTVNGVQYGTVSWSRKPCTVKGYPGVFARVSTYVEWIKTITGLEL